MTPAEASIFTGLKRVVNSAKVQVSAYGLTLAWFAIKFGTNGVDSADKSKLWLAFFISVGVVVREIVNAWGVEDAAKAQAVIPATPVPSVQVNTGDSSGNTQTSTTAIPPLDPPSAPPASVSAPKSPVNPSGGVRAVTVSTNPTFTASPTYTPTKIPKGQK